MSIKEKDLRDLIIGIIKVQAAIVETLSENNIKLRSDIEYRIHYSLTRGKEEPIQTTLANLPAQLFLKAFSPQDSIPSLQNFVDREFDKLLDKA